MKITAERIVKVIIVLCTIYLIYTYIEAIKILMIKN